MICKKYGRKISWIVKWFGQYGRKASRRVIRYEQYKRKVAKWKNKQNMEER